MVTALAPTGNPRSEDYRYQRGAGQVRCCYVVNPASPHAGWALREIIRPAYRALHRDHGLVAEALAFGVVPEPRDGVLTHVLYGPTNPLTMTSEEQAYLAALARAGVKTNIVSAYPLTADGRDRPGYERAAAVVPELCDALDVNAIYPDHLDRRQGIRTNTWQDVYVNVIGETIRVKFAAVRSLEAADAAERDHLAAAHAGDIAELARLHREFRLWQRKPFTDGSILFAHDGRWLVSQTVTDKTLMTPDDFDLVTGFVTGTGTGIGLEAERGAVTYSGPRLPSSDSPEFLLLGTLPCLRGRRPRLVVHFHHRELTRGGRFPHLVTDATIECGTFAAGRRFETELRRRDSDWFIIREHGMVWVGDTVAEFADYVERVVGPA